jgi:O-antigen ligase
MTDRDLLVIGYALVYGLAGCALALVGLGIFMQVERGVSRWTAALLAPLMTFGIALSSALSGRDLKYANISVETVAFGAAEGSAALLRVLTVVVMGLCAAAIVARGFRRQAALRLPGQALFLSFLAYFLCNNIINSIFGTIPAFSHHLVYVLFAFGAMYVCRDDPLERFIRAAKVGLLVLMVLSLVAAIVKPSLALQPDYKGWIPLVKFRFWGLGSNPNSIGPLALLLMLLEIHVPSRRTVWRLAAFGLGLVVLLLAQSKTAWAAALMLAPLLGWYRVGRSANGGMNIGFALGLIAALLGLTLGVAAIDPELLLTKLADSQIGSDLSTLTGRLQIWAAAVRAWQDNPLFGFGPLAWGPYHRATIGLPNAFSAHNQFFQSLSVAGSLGLVTVVVYLSVLGALAWNRSAATRGMSLALFLFILARCITEAPLSASTLFNGDVITQLILFRLLLEPVARRVPLESPAQHRAWNAAVPL